MNHERLFTLAAFVLLVGVIATGCTSDSPHDSAPLGERTIRILATTGMIADMAQNICGERAVVTALMGPGVDPHLYKASEGDVRRMAEADLILYNGLHLEGAMAELLMQMRQRKSTYAVAESVDSTRLLASPTYEGQHDPHIWFDVSMWIDAATGLRDLMMTLDSAHAELYRVQADSYIDSLNALHQFVLNETQRVPPERRILITAHDAFHYFGKAYDFDVRGLQGISTATEAGTADVQQLAEFIATRRIPAMFVESSVSPRSIEAVQAAVRARGYDVAIGGELFSDAMGTPGTPEGTYLGMVRHNVNTIVSALSDDEASM
ncbi:MAG: zinc ABC transporter substrate-binding protein [Candidatus Zixiibacteriota bacterium]